MLKKVNSQRKLIAQYGDIALSHNKLKKKKSYNYDPHSPFTKELLNTMTSSIKTFTPYDWQILVKALLKSREYL